MKVANYLLTILLVLGCPRWVMASDGELRLDPASPKLVGAESRQQLLVTDLQNGRERDVTMKRHFALQTQA